MNNLTLNGAHTKTSDSVSLSLGDAVLTVKLSEEGLREDISKAAHAIGHMLPPDFNTSVEFLIEAHEKKYFLDHWFACQGDIEVFSFNGIDWFKLIIK